MPKRVAKQNNADNVQKKDNSRQIKKQAKNEQGQKQLLDQAVVGNKQKTHYVLMLDESGSMAGRPFRELKESVEAFLNSLTNSREAKTCKVSCVMYNHISRIVFQNMKPSMKLLDKI